MPLDADMGALHLEAQEHRRDRLPVAAAMAIGGAGDGGKAGRSMRMRTSGPRG